MSWFKNFMGGLARSAVSGGADRGGVPAGSHIDQGRLQNATYTGSGAHPFGGAPGTGTPPPVPGGGFGGGAPPGLYNPFATSPMPGMGGGGGFGAMSTPGAPGVGGEGGGITDRIKDIPGVGSIFGGVEGAVKGAGNLVGWDTMAPEHRAALLANVLGTGANLYGARQEGKRRDREYERGQSRLDQAEEEERQRKEDREERNRKMMEVFGPMFGDYVNRAG